MKCSTPKKTAIPPETQGSVAPAGAASPTASPRAMRSCPFQGLPFVSARIAVKTIGSGILLALSLAYPFIVYFLGNELQTSHIVFGLISLFFLRSAFQYRQQGASQIFMALVLAAIMVGLFFVDDQLAVYAYPVLMSLSFACVLGWTLIYPPSLIERFARILEPDLDSRGIAYTRKVTVVWLGFSLLNASLSIATVILNDVKIWLLYNGLISYVLIGLLMGCEFLFRGYYKAKNKPQFIPAHLLLSQRDHQFWKRYWGAADFLSYPHYIRALSAKIREANAKRVFLICEDRAFFLAGFLAVLYADVPVVLPQSDSSELLLDLIESGDVLLTDQPKLEKVVNASISLNISFNLDYDAAAPIHFDPLDPEKAKVIFYTSGSTGKPKAVMKKLLQLEAEVEVLHGLWGKKPPGKFLSTVSHQHLYAFLYSLLWPVCSGTPLERLTFTYWGDLLNKSSPHDFLISSPSHLGRFLILGECKPQVFSAVFSSGAPLSYAAAIESKKYLGLLPIEVYGSTETGGIAFRQQEQLDTPWRRFDCVELASSLDNKLQIKSPYLNSSAPYQTEDQIEWVDDNAFYLLGRADRIVKIEGKRTSLAEIEDKICQSKFASEAAVLVLEKSYRDELGAVVVLSEYGVETLKACGKIAFIRLLREALTLHFHPVIIPRKWRFVPAIPVNPQGKRLQFELKQYFAKPEKSLLGSVRQPIILKKEFSAHKAEYSLKIPPDLAYFEGHFKSMPILPGVVQLKWAVEFAKADFGLKGGVSEGNQIKFSNLIRPNDEVSLVLEYNREKSSVAYRYKAGERSYSSGRITFTERGSIEL